MSTPIPAPKLGELPLYNEAQDVEPEPAAPTPELVAFADDTETVFVASGNAEIPVYDVGHAELRFFAAHVVAVAAFLGSTLNAPLSKSLD